MIRNAWYGAGWGHELGKKPLARKLVGEEIVLFRDAQGRAHAVSARCAHRSADMAAGKVVDGMLECPFHGWRFDGSGQCRFIPSQPRDAKIPPQARVGAFELREQQNVLWIWVGDRSQPLPDPPYYEKLDHGPRRAHTYARARCWKGSYLHTIENLLDVSHIPIAHEAIVRDTRTRMVPECQITRRDDERGIFVRHHVTPEWVARHGHWPLNPPWYARMLGFRPVVEETYGVDLGGVFYQTDIFDNGKWEFVLALATPADETHTWLWAMTVRTRALHVIGGWAQRWVIERINDSDEIIVESMFHDDSKAAPFREVSVVADKPSLAFRQLLSRLMRAEGRVPIMTAPGQDEALIDVREQHPHQSSAIRAR